MAPGGHLAWYGNVGGAAELRLSDFFGHARGWNAHIVGFISPVPEETLGEDLGILADLVADEVAAPAYRANRRLDQNAGGLRCAGGSFAAR